MSYNPTAHWRSRRFLVPRVLVVLTLLAGWWCGPPATARANGVPFVAGDVLADIGAGQVNHFTNAGTLLDTLDDGSGSRTTAGSCWDGAHNLYVTNFNAGTISKFDATGHLVAAAWATTPTPYPESCVFDAAGDMYVGGKVEPGIYKYDQSGRLLTTYGVTPGISGGPDWIDLAPDQCTLLYTGDAGLIFSYNVCTGEQNEPYIVGGLPWPCYTFHLLPDGEILVACSGLVWRVSPTGSEDPVGGGNLYPVDGNLLYLVGDGALFALALDPDGTSFWTADYNQGTVYRVRIADGAVLETFTGLRPGETDLDGLAVYPGPPAAPWQVALAPASQTLSVGAVATLAATVTQGGRPVAGATVTFTVSGGPNAGLAGTAVTNAAGVATLSYSSAAGGTDTVVAQATDPSGQPRPSGAVAVTWGASAAPCLVLASLRQGTSALRAIALGGARGLRMLSYDDPTTRDSFSLFFSATDPVVSCIPTPGNDMVVLALTLGAQASGTFHSGDVVLLTLGNQQHRPYGQLVDLRGGLVANPVVTFEQASTRGSVTIIGRVPAWPLAAPACCGAAARGGQ